MIAVGGSVTVSNLTTDYPVQQWHCARPTYARFELRQTERLDTTLGRPPLRPNRAYHGRTKHLAALTSDMRFLSAPSKVKPRPRSLERHRD
jgi:hypothetical protein